MKDRPALQQKVAVLFSIYLANYIPGSDHSPNLKYNYLKVSRKTKVLCSVIINKRYPHQQESKN